MYTNELKKNCVIFFLAFGVPFLSTGQNKKKDLINIHALVDSVKVRLSSHYVFPEKANIVAIHLTSQLKEGSYTPYLKDPQKLARQIEIDIKTIHQDPHL